METGSGVDGYKVEVLKLQHENRGSRNLVSIPLIPSYNVLVKETEALVTQGVGMCTEGSYYYCTIM